MLLFQFILQILNEYRIGLSYWNDRALTVNAFILVDKHEQIIIEFMGRNDNNRIIYKTNTQYTKHE